MIWGRRRRLAASAILYQYDPLGRIVQESREIFGITYDIGYRYDQGGNLRYIKYPESDIWVEYKYNQLNQLVGIAGFLDGTVDNPAFRYADNGFLTGIRYNNGTNTELTPDANYRVKDIKITNGDNKLLDISYAYGGNNNVESRTDHLTEMSNYYYYDKLDRLTSAEIAGTFYGERTGFTGIAEEDIFETLSLVKQEDYWVRFDYQANSVGVILVEPTEIGKIELIPDKEVLEHRINKYNLSVYYSDDNFIYSKLREELCRFEKDSDGKITIIFREPIEALAIKVHSRFDDRDRYFGYVDKAEFYGDLREMVKVYQRADKARLEYEYDLGGNRTVKRVIVGNNDQTSYQYYENSNRLKQMTNNLTGESYYYVYDENGNLIEKGNDYLVNLDGSVEFIKDRSAEYWHYEYTVRDRLKAVYRNEELVAEFIYDVEGKRIYSETREEGRVSYVFNYAGRVLYEEHGLEKKRSYIYGQRKQLVRVEGIVGGGGEIIYYHHDNLGSTRVMTDSQGQLIWEQDYLPFGEDLNKPGTIEIDFDITVEYKYTGQREIRGIGLYYYGARHYDPDIGRFITEDSYLGEIVNPLSQNLYIYVMQNPLKYIDPTGNVIERILEENISTDAGLTIEHGIYEEGLRYYFITIELNNFRLEPYIDLRAVKDRDDNIIKDQWGNEKYTYTSHSIEHFSERKKTPIVTINTNFFNHPDCHNIIGDVILAGKHRAFWNATKKDQKKGAVEVPYYLGIKDAEDGRQSFTIEEMELITGKGQPYRDAYLIKNRSSYDWGIGYIGGLIKDGKVLKNLGNHFAGAGVQSGTPNRSAFGISKDGAEAYIFGGYYNQDATGTWTLEKVGQFLLEEKQVYNAVYFDGGGSTSLSYGTEILITE